MSPSAAGMLTAWSSSPQFIISVLARGYFSSSALFPSFGERQIHMKRRGTQESDLIGLVF